MFDFLPIVLPLFLIIGLGFGAGQLRLLDIDVARALARFVFLFAMPLGVLSFFAQGDPPTPAVFGVMLGYFLSMVIATGASFWSARKVLSLRIREAGAHSFVSTFGNAVFLGLPIALSIEGWAQPFLMLMILEGTFVIGIGTALMTWPDRDNRADLSPIKRLVGGLGKGFLLSIKNPIVVAVFMGVAISLSHLPLPDWFEKFLKITGGAATPTGLFVLGLFMALLPKPDFKMLMPSLMMIVPTKLFLFPALTVALVGLFTKGDLTMMGAAGLFTAMPPAVTSFVQATQYRVYEQHVVASLVISTVFALITIPVFLVIFG